MAETRVVRDTPTPVVSEPKKKSPVRTLILFAILLLVIGAYAHDYFIATPAAKKAHDDIQTLVDERNAQGVKDGKLVTSEDIQATVGKAPSKVDKQKDYTIEVYRFWGGMMPQRQYVSVLYTGEEPRRHHVHYLNSMPEEGDLPVDTLSNPTKSDGKTVSGPGAPGPAPRTEAEGGTTPPAEGSDAPGETEKAAPSTETTEPAGTPAEPAINGKTSDSSDAPAADATEPAKEANPE
jgi:hypothetical protein